MNYNIIMPANELIYYFIFFCGILPSGSPHDFNNYSSSFIIFRVVLVYTHIEMSVMILDVTFHKTYVRGSIGNIPQN